VPNEAGVYAIFDGEELLYVGMAGRNGSGSLRKRLKDHATGQVVNMFAQYLFLARVQFSIPERVKHPNEAKQACRAYIHQRCSLSYKALPSAAEARSLELELRRLLKPALNAEVNGDA